MNPLQTLLELQETDNRIRELERELKDLPRRKAQESARLKGVNASLSIAKNQLAAMQQRINESEAEHADAKSRIQELKITQATASSNKEYQQLSIKIEELEQMADAADERGIAASDNVPELERAVKDAEAKVGVESGSVDVFCKEIDDRIAKVKAEYAEQQAKRAEQVKLVNPKAYLYYERLKVKRWPVVVMLNSDSVCEGCHLVVPPSTEQSVEHKIEMVACTNCGRLLYREK